MVYQADVELIVRRHVMEVQHRLRVTDVLALVAQDALAVRLPHLVALALIRVREGVIHHVREPVAEQRQVQRVVLALIRVREGVIQLVQEHARELLLVQLVLLAVVHAQVDVRAHVLPPVLVDVADIVQAHVLLHAQDAKGHVVERANLVVIQHVRVDVRQHVRPIAGSLLAWVLVLALAEDL